MPCTSRGMPRKRGRRGSRSSWDYRSSSRSPSARGVRRLACLSFSVSASSALGSGSDGRVAVPPARDTKSDQGFQADAVGPVYRLGSGGIEDVPMLVAKTIHEASESDKLWDDEEKRKKKESAA